MTRSNRPRGQKRPPRKHADGSTTSSEMEPDEVALWRKVPAVDSSAIEALARRYRSIAIALARTKQGRGFGDDDLIDEATQALREAIIQVDQGRLATFKAFAKTIVHRRLVDLHRKLGPYSAHECQQAAEFEAAKSDLYRASREVPTDGETYDHLSMGRRVRPLRRTSVTSRCRLARLFRPFVRATKPAGGSGSERRVLGGRAAPGAPTSMF